MSKSQRLAESPIQVTESGGSFLPTSRDTQKLGVPSTRKALNFTRSVRVRAQSSNDGESAATWNARLDPALADPQFDIVESEADVASDLEERDPPLLHERAHGHHRVAGDAKTPEG